MLRGLVHWMLAVGASFQAAKRLGESHQRPPYPLRAGNCPEFPYLLTGLIDSFSGAGCWGHYEFKWRPEAGKRRWQCGVDLSTWIYRRLSQRAGHFRVSGWLGEPPPGCCSSSQCRLPENVLPGLRHKCARPPAMRRVNCRRDRRIAYWLTMSDRIKRTGRSVRRSTPLIRSPRFFSRWPCQLRRMRSSSFSSANSSMTSGGSPSR